MLDPSGNPVKQPQQAARGAPPPPPPQAAPRASTHLQTATSATLPPLPTVQPASAAPLSARPSMEIPDPSRLASHAADPSAGEQGFLIQQIHWDWLSKQGCYTVLSNSCSSDNHSCC